MLVRIYPTRLSVSENLHVNYRGKLPRTVDIFKDLGSKDLRKKYIISRLAFIQAYFEYCEVTDVVIYRGMSSEQNFKPIHRTLLNTSLSLKIAQAFTDFEQDSVFKNSYLVKATIPISQIFMTCLETKAMNERYQEKECIIFYHGEFSI